MTSKITQILHKRGLSTNLPTLGASEIAYTTDTQKLYYGTGSSNIEVAKKSDMPTISTSTSSTSTTTVASSSAVKLAYDLAKEAKQSASEMKSSLVAKLTGAGVSATSTETISSLISKLDKLEDGGKYKIGDVPAPVKRVIAASGDTGTLIVSFVQEDYTNFNGFRLVVSNTGIPKSPSDGDAYDFPDSATSRKMSLAPVTNGKQYYCRIYPFNENQEMQTMLTSYDSVYVFLQGTTFKKTFSKSVASSFSRQSVDVDLEGNIWYMNGNTAYVMSPDGNTTQSIGSYSQMTSAKFIYPDNMFIGSEYSSYSSTYSYLMDAKSHSKVMSYTNYYPMTDIALTEKGEKYLLVHGSASDTSSIIRYSAQNMIISTKSIGKQGYSWSSKTPKKVLYDLQAKTIAYADNYSSNSIGIYSTDGTYISSIYIGTTVCDFACDNNGAYYYASDTSISKYNIAELSVMWTVNSTSAIKAFCVDESLNVFYITSDGVLTKLLSDGTVSFSTNISITNAVSISADKGSNLYIATSNGYINKVTY